MIKIIPDVLTDDLCIEIVDELDKISDNCFIIPKNDKTWIDTEYFLYRQLLIAINDYEKKRETPLFLSHFKICKIEQNAHSEIKNFSPFREINSHNVLTFIFFLTSDDDSFLEIFDEKIPFQQGALVIFPDDIQYIYNIICKRNNFIIMGQLVDNISTK